MNNSVNEEVEVNKIVCHSGTAWQLSQQTVTLVLLGKRSKNDMLKEMS